MNKQNKIIVGVVALILALTIGYAIFTQSLNISGTAKAGAGFGLIFEKSANDPTCRGYSGGDDCHIDDVAEIIEDGKTLKITIDKLLYPTAYVKIPVLIKNTGTVDAVLKSMEIKDLESNDIDVKYSITEQDIKDGYVVKPGDDNRKEVEVEISWNKDSTNNGPIEVNFSITMNYEQASNAVVTTSSSSDSFPVVQGSLGGNVTFTYDNGNISIDGTGDMGDGLINGDYGYCKSYVATLGTNNCTLSADITVKLMEKLSTDNENINSLLVQLMPAYISGIKTEAIEGMSEEDAKNALYESFSKEDVDRTFDILNNVPTLKSINIGENVTSLRDDLLYGTRINSIVIPDSIKDIGSISGISVDTLKIGKGVEILSVGAIRLSTINNLILSEGLGTIAQGAISTTELETIVNKTGNKFDWNGILTGTSGTAFETGTVEYDGKTITITK